MQGSSTKSSIELMSSTKSSIELMSSIELRVELLTLSQGESYQPRLDLRNRGLASENQALEAIGSLLKLIHPTPMNSISRARVIGALSGPFPTISITSMWRIAYGHTSQG
ncbi:unnamed protein product [Microthlaspi erraticum]|uniref:Uncharacterized protein n=1 Tax=Microthlaspi erraticum TaxID=1685480 RepID=A0A6D2JCZ5_9BRAS|nr:unnamed protein product [Microthlaspi erraticum]CAA7038798.1 unnamed protein product [Microthlaspi erraticum]CAA7051116.1 unnamed protein product [Microthlaspi erraticum]